MLSSDGMCADAVLPVLPVQDAPDGKYFSTD